MTLNQTALRVDLFHGPVTSTEATLYAQVARPSADANWQLRGQLRGPMNRRAETLPATLKFHDAGPGDSVLAKVRVPDPCSWSMDLPSLYDVQLELFADDQPSQVWQGVTGFRDFGPAGSSFSLNGERWVIRGQSLAPNEEFHVASWREERLVCFCELPSESALRTASEQGAYLLVRLTGENADAIHHEFCRVAVWPAVLGVVVSEGMQLEPEVIANSNVAIGTFGSLETIERLSAIPEKERAFGFVCAEVDVARELAKSARSTLPVVAISSSSGGRAAIDRLQSELTPGNFAGYVV